MRAEALPLFADSSRWPFIALAPFSPFPRCTTRHLSCGENMTRRSFALSLGTAIIGAAFSRLALGQSNQRAVDANRVFAHLLDFYGLPAGERSHFHPVYKLSAATGAIPPISIATASTRRALTLGGAGQVLDPPTAAELQSHAQVIIGGSTRMSAAMSLEPILALSTNIRAADAVTALAQANAAIGRFAGAMALLAPHLSGIGFGAPRVAAATVLLTNAQRAPMPYVASRFEFRPSAIPNASTLSFVVAPTDANFLQ